MPRKLIALIWIVLGFFGAEVVHRSYDWAVYRPLCANYAQTHGVVNAATLTFGDISGTRLSSIRFCRMTDPATGFPVSVRLDISAIASVGLELLRILQVGLMAVPVVYGFVRAARASPTYYSHRPWRGE
jgi:hypothetical protein